MCLPVTACEYVWQRVRTRTFFWPDVANVGFLCKFPGIMGWLDYRRGTIAYCFPCDKPLSLVFSPSSLSWSFFPFPFPFHCYADLSLLLFFSFFLFSVSTNPLLFLFLSLHLFCVFELIPILLCVTHSSFISNILGVHIKSNSGFFRPLIDYLEMSGFLQWKVDVMFYLKPNFQHDWSMFTYQNKTKKNTTH